MNLQKCFTWSKYYQICVAPKNIGASLSLIRRHAKSFSVKRVKRPSPIYPIIPVSNRPVMNNFDYFLVLDFEATCDKPVTPKPQEIIEFPVLKVNAKTFRTEAVFHRYVEPYVNKNLSSFCIELTGIVQDMVDGQQNLSQILQEFEKWMNEQGLLNGQKKFTFVTCGDWDLQIMLPSQCKYFNLIVPAYMKSWINIKKSFSDAMSVWPRNLEDMSSKLQLPFEGRLHSGIDDCKNISHILKALAETKGYSFTENGHLNDPQPDEKVQNSGTNVALTT